LIPDPWQYKQGSNNRGQGGEESQKRQKKISPRSDCLRLGIGNIEIKGAVEIHMDGVIYSEGFNKDTFMKTLETLNECIEKAESLIAGG
jgi:hypothetical protein